MIIRGRGEPHFSLAPSAVRTQRTWRLPGDRVALWISALIVLHRTALKWCCFGAARARRQLVSDVQSHLGLRRRDAVLGYWLAEHQGMGVAGLLFAIFWSSVVSAGVLIARWWVVSRPNSASVPTAVPPEA